MADWPDIDRRGYQADISSAVGLMDAHVRIDNYKRLLARALAVGRSKHWKDKAGLSLASHPLWDDIDAALHD